MTSGSKQIPDGWIGCPPFGGIIDDIFLPMKTLLHEKILVPPEDKFTPDIFANQMRDRGIDIGLVVNLTFTKRYYDHRDIDLEIEYRHIACAGNEAPGRKERSEFNRICNSFLAKNSNKIIAVHCTHGFNRTGFMISQYLCSQRNWTIDAAVAQFAFKRPQGIYKQEYINELFNTLGNWRDPIRQAPPPPPWAKERSKHQTNRYTYSLPAGRRGPTRF